MKFALGFVTAIVVLVGVVYVLATNLFGITTWLEEKFPL